MDPPDDIEPLLPQESFIPIPIEKERKSLKERAIFNLIGDIFFFISFCFFCYEITPDQAHQSLSFHYSMIAAFLILKSYSPLKMISVIYQIKRRSADATRRACSISHNCIFRILILSFDVVVTEMGTPGYHTVIYKVGFFLVIAEAAFIFLTMTALDMTFDGKVWVPDYNAIEMRTGISHTEESAAVYSTWSDDNQCDMPTNRQLLPV